MLTYLDPNFSKQPFPDVHNALKNPDGLVAVGGCLSPERLINAYKQGIFPWFNPGDPLLWWSPDPRLSLFPNQFKPSKSLQRLFKKNKFTLTVNQFFPEVIQACARPRKNQPETWISPEMISAYKSLHNKGFAHSVEVSRNNTLVGGLYGVSIGQVFFGESMFHIESNASKIAFYYLIMKLREWDYHLIDCQVKSDHLINWGAKELPRTEFIALVNQYCVKSTALAAWKDNNP
ncbi:MAG TPA: leucyl/phenylalanyl-tRNA--protein transferase [Methylococcaceae bacterium]|nr:leucyl/phenylalanyl-tRNA--protein transferase [Methylococcaceae bacterium]HIL40457.1 leucyl/phenylalanyl-tRNA--protein transferase [Methylococcales bacterium]